MKNLSNHDIFKTFISDTRSKNQLWTTKTLAEKLLGKYGSAQLKTIERMVKNSELAFEPLSANTLKDEHGRNAKKLIIEHVLKIAKKKRTLVLFSKLIKLPNQRSILIFHDQRIGRRWIALRNQSLDPKTLLNSLQILLKHERKNLLILPSGQLVELFRKLSQKERTLDVINTPIGKIHLGLEIYSHGQCDISWASNTKHKIQKTKNLTHLDRLEAESIHIFREVIAEAENPVMLYSLGKDSSVMLHIALKAFYPSRPPFSLLHIDTRWKFQAMYDFRDYMIKKWDMDLLIHINQEGVTKNINPLDHGSAIHTEIMKTEGLKQALDENKFDFAIVGARRDEEKSRAKERIFSFRTKSHHWDIKNQRPEIWNLYNGRKGPDESIRVFPLSNWSEIDIWQYIYREQISIVPLYLAAERPVIERDSMLILVDDDRLNVHPNEKIQIKKVRFRSLGCYPLTGAIESEADDLESIVLEISKTNVSERLGRKIDIDSSESMEKKKIEGYF